MKYIITLAVLFVSLSSKAQLDCYMESNDHTTLPISSLSQVVENCSLVADEEYWMCKGLTERNCGLVRGDKEYWKCKALTTGDCGLSKTNNDYWFCKGITESNCGVIQSNLDYWMCRGIVSDGCQVVSGKDYWLCRVLKNTYP